VTSATAPAKQRISAYRRWFQTLHPSLQLVFLQLWMPLFFIIGFCLCYVFAFHAPHPHDVPVGIIGSDPTLSAAVSKALPGQYVFDMYTSVAQAKHDVLGGTIAVAYDPATNEFFKASAHQYQVAALVPATLSAVLEAGGANAPTLTELAPLPTWDEYGTVSMYVMLAWCIGGYMVSMFIGIMGGPLSHRTRTAVIVVGGIVISLITNTLAGPVVGAIHGHFLELVLIAWGWIVAIGLTVNGLSYFAGRFIAAPAMICFVFLSMPSSGGAYPKWFMPEPFAWLNHVVVGSSMVDMIKYAVYGVGPGYGRGLVTMGCYAAAGVVLMIVGKLWWEHRRLRAILTGRTTMFMDAQNLNREFLGKQRERELERHGLRSTSTGTLSLVPESERVALTGDGGELARQADAAELARQGEALEDERMSGDVFMGGPDGLESPLPTGVVPVVRSADGVPVSPQTAPASGAEVGSDAEPTSDRPESQRHRHAAR
jgi:hypothetical protein